MISQREARRLQKQVRHLHTVLDLQRRAWGDEWPDGGVNIGRLSADTQLQVAVETARKLRHAVVVTVSDGRLLFHALPLPKETR